VNVYPFIEAERVARVGSVRRACLLLKVSRAAYYASSSGSLCERRLADEELLGRIAAAHKASRGTYGSPRITRALRAAGLAVGDRVCALVAGGGYAEYCAAPVGQCLSSPANLSDIEAASLPETFFTVWSNVFDRARLQPGETLLVHGGSSGIGVTAIQLAKAFGATVIVTVGNAEKAAACRALGADHAIDYKTQDFVAEVLRLTGGQGANVVLDMVAGDYLGRDVKCLAEDGRVVVIAVQGGINSTIDASLVLRRRLTITGSTLRPRPVAFKSAIAVSLRKTVWPWLESGRVKPVVHQVFPAAEAARAHELMESNRHIGKLVLAW